MLYESDPTLALKVPELANEVNSRHLVDPASACISFQTDTCVLEPSCISIDWFSLLNLTPCYAAVAHLF